MSSPESPPIRTELLDRGGERLVVTVSGACALALPWLLSIHPLTRAASALVLLLVLALAWHSVGWLGGRRRIDSAVWAADGTWILRYADGRRSTGQLTDATRVLPPFVLLALRSQIGRSYILVWGSGQPEFRRLVARLLLERRRPGMLPGQARALA
ncbi:MAG TPA: hypothetical protein VLT59_06110 [Steroidobacteraceae bacterium]|nr:hypothetical protein [Steroidobacteraceae bacterium]